MKKFLLYPFYLLLCLAGLFQFLLIPGFAWYFVFPWLPVLAIGVGYFYFQQVPFIKKCTLLLVVASIASSAISLVSHWQISDPLLDQEVRILSYNLFFKNRSPASSLAVIQQAEADVLLVQELTPKWQGILKQALSKKYPYQLTKPLKGTHGIGIYSKYKIDNVSYLINSAQLPFAQTADLHIQNKTIQLINTHLASPAIAVENKDRFLPLYWQNYQRREQQLTQINQLANQNSEQYHSQLLVGDLNTLSSEPIFQKLKLSWTPSYSHALRWKYFNFPNTSRSSPLLTLDYLLAKGHVQFLNLSILPGGNSDHLAILGTIKI